jgi:hypothetical protein
MMKSECTLERSLLGACSSVDDLPISPFEKFENIKIKQKNEGSKRYCL